jgi:ribonuclease VapC
VIVDTSAIIAILREEGEADAFLLTLDANRPAKISAGSWIELGAVLSGFGIAELEEQLLHLKRVAGIQIEPVTEQQAEIGRRAYLTYGKGNHSARLNFGDCFAYALAKATGEPLLFKGNDFVHTDVTPAA